MDADLDTLATALYVRVDDWLKTSLDRAPARPLVGIAPRISDAELLILAVMQALLGFTSEARWLRHTWDRFAVLFPYLPLQPGHNKRMRALASTIHWLIGVLARDTSVWIDDVWVVDSRRWSVAVRGRQPDVRTWLVGPSMATAPAIPATSRVCGCTWSPPCRACRSATRSPARRPTNVKSSSTCSTKIRRWPAHGQGRS